MTVLKNVPFGNRLEKRHALILIQLLGQAPKEIRANILRPREQGEQISDGRRPPCRIGK